MNSTTSMIAEEYRIQQWVAGIQACQIRPKDIYVAAWCHEHGITKANYYYRLRRVREATKNREWRNCLEKIAGTF
ncbi:MAG: hypothetical protein QM683_11170 [Lacrimispora sp.]